MGDLTNLNAADAALVTAVTGLSADVTVLSTNTAAAVAALQAANGAGDQAGIDAATASLVAQNAALATLDTNLKAASAALATATGTPAPAPAAAAAAKP